MEQDIFSDLISFVHTSRWKYRKELTRETQLERDLSLTGDDAVEFMESFFSKFNIEFSNFEFSKYFDDEGLLININWFKQLIWGTPLPKRSKHKLTLGDLEKAIIDKKWNNID